ncbi:MAG: NAD(P)-dependent oxidoreductase [bacterium]
MKVLLCDPVADVVLDHFQKLDNFTVHEVFERSELLNDLDDANFLVVRSGTTVDREILDNAPELKGIVRAGVGLDNIDLDYADEKGVKVQNTPEASTNAVAELVIGHILSLFRSIPQADAAMKDGDWIKSQLDGREIQGKTVGVIGYGRIGQRVDQLVKAFGAETIAYDAILDDNKIKDLGGSPVGLDDLIGQADIVTVHVPLTDQTRHMIGTEELQRLHDDAVVINCSRGGHL